MTISNKNVARLSGLIFGAMLALVASSSVQAAEIAVSGVSTDVKATMQLGLSSTSTGPGANVDAAGDVRVYKGDSSSSTANDKNNNQETSTDVDLAATVQSDENVTKVESDDESVSLWYKVPAKLFGFIPMGMTVRTTVGAAGEVKVSHPWYSFLVSSEDDDAEAVIQTEVNATLGASGTTTDGDAKLTGAAKAAFVKAIHSGLKSTVGAQASVDASAGASY
ncbi:MAG: hypothetical protein AAB365_02525 [Patescibacteria group bacterium]